MSKEEIKRNGQTDPTRSSHTSPGATPQRDRTLLIDTKHRGVLKAGRAGGERRGVSGDLPCRRAPFLLKKVLPGQMGGPDVLKQKRKQREGQLMSTHLPAHRRSP